VRDLCTFTNTNLLLLYIDTLFNGRVCLKQNCENPCRCHRLGQVADRWGSDTCIAAPRCFLGRARRGDLHSSLDIL
jgi:hypothetical protein